MPRCSERDSLHSHINVVLNDMVELLQRTRSAIERNDYETALNFDKQMELAVGEKERSFGALRQHVKDHGC